MTTGKDVDLGHVGTVTRVDRTTIENLVLCRAGAGDSVDVPGA